ncbi:MAG: Holliday junction resolvase RuvX [Deltaproteobacteria bacterium]|nr:Holliday junction resolvase RuvX [Deltaproteobacteria bacterium]
MKILGLDPGSKRVGVAISDDLGIAASGLTTLTRTKLEPLLESIQDLCQQHGVEKIVVGLPKRMDGSLGPEADRVLALTEALKEKLNLEVVTWDERFSTIAVERVLIEADLSRKKRKKVRDKVAAVYILQGYLDSLGSFTPGEP